MKKELIIELFHKFEEVCYPAVSDHFVDVNKMIEIGKGGNRNCDIERYFYIHSNNNKMIKYK
jgi:hypothetical protein